LGLVWGHPPGSSSSGGGGGAGNRRRRSDFAFHPMVESIAQLDESYYRNCCVEVLTNLEEYIGLFGHNIVEQSL
jgi:hypothetical protein